jgi:glycolate oxidase FAD binding subunit
MDSVVQRLSETIREAAAQKRPLCIRGGGTKDFYGGAIRGDKLNTGDCRGIVSYEPTELVITARGGTPLAEVEAALREKGQMLPFEPPHFGEIPSPPPPLPSGEGNIVPPERKGRMATLGGCVAAGLSGPRRPYAGAVRDFVLGVRILDGKGEDLRFGGQVMKNVAGYDVSRLMAGSLGTLGLLLEVSLKVLPRPAVEATLHLKCREAEAIARMNEWAGRPLPITATTWSGGDLGVRLSGSHPGVAAAVTKLGGTLLDALQAERFWTAIREHTDPFFAAGGTLWRLSVKPTTPPLGLPGAQLIEWGGALRWLRTDKDADPKAIRDAAARAGGHATMFRSGDRTDGVFQPLAPALMKLHRNLKRAFDPAGIFNPGRLYPDL